MYLKTSCAYLVNILMQFTKRMSLKRHTGVVSYKGLQTLQQANPSYPNCQTQPSFLRNYGLAQKVWISIVSNVLHTIIVTLSPDCIGTQNDILGKAEELRKRCADLLNAPGNYDRVVREATTILESRIRSRPPIEVLAKAIPNSSERQGENLVNKLTNPDNPMLSISSDKAVRIAFRNMLVGVVSYLRNPYHHRLDDTTEWSWTWSTVGLIDKLLTDIGNCVLNTN
ncbi:MAG: hypothetical protein FJ316_02880 [SAR202 cluster bacterium]|nr:hypothetical protein [SAR202 cluster bacterium]